MEDRKKIMSKFAMMNRYPSLSKLLEVNLRMAKFNGMKEALESADDLDEWGFYLKIYLRIHEEQIKSSSGENVMKYVDMNNRDLINKKYNELGAEKNTLVRMQRYAEAANCRDQQKWLLRRLNELDAIAKESNIRSL